MGISLAKITDFFGLADDDMYEEVAAPAPKKQVSRPQSAPKRTRNGTFNIPKARKTKRKSTAKSTGASTTTSC